MAARVATLFLTLIAVAKGELIEELTISNGPTEMSAQVKAEDAMEIDNVPDSTAMVEEITDAGVMNETGTTLKPESPTARRNVTFVNQTDSGFMPSFHLGPIAAFPSGPPLYDLHRQASSSGSSDRTNSPFDGQRAAMKFEGSQSNRNRNEKHSNPSFRPSDRDENYVKFEDDKSEDHHSHEDGGTKCHKETNRQGEPSSVEAIVHQPDYAEHQQVVGYAGGNYGGGQQYVTTYQTKPLKTHEATGYGVPYQQAILANDNNQYMQYHAGQYDGYHDENAIKPETIINVHPVSFQTTNVDALSKPKTVVYVTTHETIRTRKIPYPQYYQHQPQVYEHTEPPMEQLPVEHEDPYQYPVFYDHHQHHKSISPWKKILHLIGAFLPIGLLIALLSPKVISANTNAGAGASGDPNIVLSKLRVNDLSAEHKRTRLALDTGTCEERSICRLLVAAGEDGAELLKEMLVYAAERTAESAVRKKELDRIFEAAKLGNCDILTCGFYDGT